jgi:hypothetical protein
MKNIGKFFLCMLRDDCKYSIKKFLVYIFSIVIIYLVIFTTKNYYELLTFVAVLLGIRSYERLKSGKYAATPSTEDNTQDDNSSDKPVDKPANGAVDNKAKGVL